MATQKDGINLNKGSKIDLKRDGEILSEVCIGLNWGAISKPVFFGIFKESVSVDLDGSVTMYDKEKNILETVYYKKLRSKDGSIVHSGDDRDGDVMGDDGYDNEVIQIKLSQVKENVHSIVFYLNSYHEQDFKDLPYAKIRIFEGNLHKLNSVFATFNLSAEDSFKGNVSMVMGKLVRTKNTWEFVTIGDAVPSKNIDETILYIKANYLD